MMQEELSLPSISDSLVMSFDTLLQNAVRLGASDMHLSCGQRPKYRIDGELRDVDSTAEIDPRWMASEMKRIMSEDQFRLYISENELDFSYGVDGYGRFRVNFYKQSGSPAAVFRAIPEDIKTLDQLQLPETLSDITHKPNGLVLVTGPTGSGKSTTLAAMIEARNRTYHEHIMTIEDPVEFIYQSKRALVNQREVGSDTASFHEALKRVLRQDPDVILIGELRDPETIQVALTAAETGHLVFGTLHTQSAAKSINRIIDSFPAAQQGQIRSQLADTLQAIISQSLLKRKDGGRVAATEILVKCTAVSNNIREGNTSQINSAIQTGKNIGMHTLDQDLKRLVQTGVISKEVAKDYLTDPEALDAIYTTSA